MTTQYNSSSYSGSPLAGEISTKNVIGSTGKTETQMRNEIKVTVASFMLLKLKTKLWLCERTSLLVRKSPERYPQYET